MMHAFAHCHSVVVLSFILRLTVKTIAIEAKAALNIRSIIHNNDNQEDVVTFADRYIVQHKNHRQLQLRGTGGDGDSNSNNEDGDDTSPSLGVVDPTITESSSSSSSGGTTTFTDNVIGAVGHGQSSFIHAIDTKCLNEGRKTVCKFVCGHLIVNIFRLVFGQQQPQQHISPHITHNIIINTNNTYIHFAHN
jgi:hypothetical protein